VRIMTPLIKFRACRDARKVTGDAMEVRGGCGYVEEWPDGRLLRDAHLGSIWEGTSNIVALDVLRAIARNESLPVLMKENGRRLAEAALEQDLSSQLGEMLERVCVFSAKVADDADERMARQVSSSLYHITSAIGLAAEAAKLDAPHRRAMAQLVLQHRLAPRDPISPDNDAGLINALLEA
jgi:acyl-CoA dehydrogenase